jgi:hypothetical protein
VKVTEVPEQKVLSTSLLDNVAMGNAFTVTVDVIVQPLLFLYVIKLVPAETPVTTPELFTVATPVEADIQGVVASAVAEPVNVVVVSTQTFKPPVIVGKSFTVTIAVVVQPLLFLYVIKLVPAETPVTTPELFTVATPVEADIQGVVASAVAEPLNAVVAPTQTLKVPVIVGKAFTVLIIPELVAVQPDALVTITSTTCPLVKLAVVYVVDAPFWTLEPSTLKL